MERSEVATAAERFEALVDEHGSAINALEMGLRFPLTDVRAYAQRDGWDDERWNGLLDGLGIGLCAREWASEP